MKGKSQVFPSASHFQCCRILVRKCLSTTEIPVWVPCPGPAALRWPITVGAHHTPQHVFVVILSAKWKPPASGLPFSSAWSLHTNPADAPRVSELRLTILKAGRASNVMHPCQQRSCQGENPRFHRGLGHVERRFHVQACHERRVISVKSWLQLGPAVCLPLPMSLDFFRYRGLHVFTIDSSLGSLMQTPPFNRLFLPRAAGPPEPLCTILQLRLEGPLPGSHVVPSQSWRLAS